MKNPEVTAFLDDPVHPRRNEIEALRTMILDAHPELVENIKWNGPNYCFRNEDRITMRLNPPGQVQLIFHRGAKKTAQPAGRLIDDPSGLLVWKENDRAVASFHAMEEIKDSRTTIMEIVRAWILQAAPSANDE